MKLILATKNPGKIKEITNILGDLGIEIISMNDAGFAEEIVEDGKTLEQNALLKAQAVSNFTHEWTAADDTGIFIDAMNGEPGIHARRWSGDNATAKQLIDFTLEKLKDIPEGKRTAHFETAVVLMHPSGSFRTFMGKVSGKILMQPQGTLIESQPYSVLFVPDGYTKSLAELSLEEKNSVSHRGQAFQKVKTFLKNEVLKGQV